MAETDTLLAHMVAKLTSQGEDAATEALAYLLNKSETCRTALVDLLRERGLDLNSIAQVRTQVIAPDGTRPDMVGYDEAGAKRLIVEAKFWAGLRETQVAGYLQQFEHDGPGALLFIAPARRLETLWAEILRLTQVSDLQRVDQTKGRDEEFRSAMIAGANKHLTLLSWELLFDRLAPAARDSQLAAEIEQLRGLAVRQEEAAFLPLHSEDTAATIPRRLQGFYRLVDHVVDARGVPGGLMSTRGARATATRNFYGRYLRLPGIPGFLFLCVHLRLWGRKGETPIWFGIGRSVPIPPGALTGERTPSRDDTHPAYRFVPIQLRTGVEYEDVLDDVVRQVKEIHDLASGQTEGRQQKTQQGDRGT